MEQKISVKDEEIKALKNKVAQLTEEMRSNSSSSFGRIAELEDLMKLKIEEYEKKIAELNQSWTEKNEKLSDEIQKRINEHNKLVIEHENLVKNMKEKYEDEIQVKFFQVKSSILNLSIKGFDNKI